MLVKPSDDLDLADGGVAKGAHHERPMWCRDRPLDRIDRVGRPDAHAFGPQVVAHRRRNQRDDLVDAHDGDRTGDHGSASDDCLTWSAESAGLQLFGDPGNRICRRVRGKGDRQPFVAIAIEPVDRAGDRHLAEPDRSIQIEHGCAVARETEDGRGHLTRRRMSTCARHQDGGSSR